VPCQLSNAFLLAAGLERAHSSRIPAYHPQALDFESYFGVDHARSGGAMLDEHAFALHPPSLSASPLFGGPQASTVTTFLPREKSCKGP
jgi:hypothetical protein